MTIPFTFRTLLIYAPQPTKAMLRIIEIFNSIQGEAGRTGLPTAFVRLARCNIRCGYCDTPYSFGAGEEWSEDAIMARLDSYGVHHVCVTGGEPMLHGAAVCALMRRMISQKYTVTLETNGIIPLQDVPPEVIKVMDIKTPGALGAMGNENAFLEKHLHYPNLELLTAHDEVKFVLTGRLDYEWAKAFIDTHQLVERSADVYLSPSFDDLKASELVEWILTDKLNVRLNLQTHKFIWGPEAQGV